MKMSKVQLYSSWFCPFAQRVWVALELKGIPFEYKEINPYEKTAEFLALNPRGLVPTLVHNMKSIYESTILLEYIDEAFPEFKKNCNLFPGDAFERAQQRLWIDHINKHIVPKFYQILQFEDLKKRNDSTKQYFEKLTMLFQNMDKDGPFFKGKNISAVDIAFLPWADRM